MPPPRPFEQKMRISGAASPVILALKLAKNAGAAPRGTEILYKICKENLGAAPRGTENVCMLCVQRCLSPLRILKYNNLPDSLQIWKSRSRAIWCNLFMRFMKTDTK